jgi:hypothetical protein
LVIQRVATLRNHESETSSDGHGRVDHFLRDADAVPESSVSVTRAAGDGSVLVTTTFGGAALPGATILVRSSSGVLRCVSDVTGRCSMHVSPGEWAATMELEGLKPAHTNLRVTATENVTVHAALGWDPASVITIAEPAQVLHEPLTFTMQ